MRVLITLFIFSIVASAVSAQSVQQKTPMPSSVPNAAPVRIMTTEEANRLNGTAHPVIDGIPYEQYKAQQQAIKAAVAPAPQGLKIIQAAPVTDPAAGRKNEPAPVVPVLQQAAPAEKAEATPAVKPVLSTGVFREAKTQP